MNSLISISATLAYVNYFSSVVLMPMINITISIISAVIIIKRRNWFKIELKIFSFNRRQGIKLSKTTVHKFMNQELQTYCVPAKNHLLYVEGTKHELFPNRFKT